MLVIKKKYDETFQESLQTTPRALNSEKCCESQLEMISKFVGKERESGKSFSTAAQHFSICSSGKRGIEDFSSSMGSCTGKNANRQSNSTKPTIGVIRNNYNHNSGKIVAEKNFDFFSKKK